MWTLFWKICIKNQWSSKATESKGLFHDGWEKTSYQGISAEGYRQKHTSYKWYRDTSCLKKGLLEKQQCSKHLRHIAIEKDIFSEVNRCIFQISLKYKLVKPKILFILTLCNFNFTSKLRNPPTKLPPPPRNNITPSPAKIKFSDPPPPPL